MSKLIAIHTPDGETFINPDKIVFIKKSTEQGIYIRMSDSTGFNCPEENLKTIKTAIDENSMPYSTVNKLILAIERLSVRIPSSIRLHM